MSVENLKKYGQLCAEDEKIRARAKEIGIKDMDSHITYGKSLGLEFSREDFEALSKEAGIDGKSELSEGDLKKVAGGVVTSTAVVAVLVGAVAGAGCAAAANEPGW